jgi:pimeloyl-ACP methyl ester carboxylesterase
MGGFVTATAALSEPRLGGIVVIDTPLRDRPPEESRLSGSNRRPRGYPTREEIQSRFTSVPPQDTILSYVGSHIAWESVRETENGWFWKFDTQVFESGLFASSPPPAATLSRALSETTCEKGYLRCQFGIVPRQMAVDIRDMLRGTGSYVELPDAGHHPMLDQPLVLTAVIRTLLAAWSAGPSAR